MNTKKDIGWRIFYTNLNGSEVSAFGRTTTPQLMSLGASINESFFSLTLTATNRNITAVQCQFTDTMGISQTTTINTEVFGMFWQ